MEPIFILVLALSALIGVTLGLLGGGGSILTVPLLVYVAGFGEKEAIAASLFIVGTTSIVATIGHARNRRVQWRTGLIFGAASMIGAFAGGWIGGYVPGNILLILFAIMMLATSIAMIRGRKKPKVLASAETTDAPVAPRSLPLGRILLDGGVVGLATGMVGAGGGFLVVPALNLLGGLPMAVAVGTSLLVIVMKSFAGLSGYLFSVQLDWTPVLAITGMAILGSFAGAALAGKINETKLRKIFGYFVLVMGVFVLGQELIALI
ncbi:sulfite exporter TauE/SafE family protein [Micrococcoides hystricis]|uniref:Probable membrane transporter protein n=1 Tax=Micrococcoides hystricis TaxID=1572761 RepID=A0ABV6PE97_9MICC